MSKKDFKGGLNTLLGETPQTEKDLELKGYEEYLLLQEAKKKAGIPKDAPTGTYEEYLLLQDEKGKRGRPKTQFKEITKSSQEGTKVNETRATFIVNEDLLEKLKALAYWDRVLIKDVINTALQDIVTNYESKNGIIKPIPKK